MKNTMSMKAAPVYPWAWKQGSPSISSCASWLAGLYRSSPCSSRSIRLYGGYSNSSWLAVFNPTARISESLKCQPIAKLDTLYQSSNRSSKEQALLIPPASFQRNSEAYSSDQSAKEQRSIFLEPIRKGTAKHIPRTNPQRNSEATLPTRP